MADFLNEEAIALIRQMFQEFQSQLRNEMGHRKTSVNITVDMSVAKTTTAHSKGASADVDLYSGGAPTGVTVSANNLFGNLATGMWCFAVHVGGSWELISGEC